MEQTGEHRESKLSVFRTHPEFTALIVLVGFYLFISNFFAWDLAWVNLAFNTSGGSDPYYNYRVIQYILAVHHSLLFDPSLNYPLGALNPRPPFFHWFTVMVAVLISPAVGGVNLGAYYFFNELDALFGALLIIPVYLLAKDVFGKKAGIVAAALYALMPSNLSSGVLTDGRMHTPELLFAFFAVYFFQKAVGTISKTRMIENLYHVRSYVPSILKYIGENRLSMIYVLLSGASLGGLILSWQGYPYIEVIILLYVVVQLVVNVMTKKPTGYLTYLTILFIGFGFLLGAYPYYALGSGYFHLWFIDPFYIGVIIIGLGIVFNIFGRKPWIITIPSIIIIAVISIVVLSRVAPGILNEIISGQGYFVKNRLYTTIQEAQSPPLGQYVSGFGAGQFILGMAGVAYIVYLYLKERKESLLFLLVFSVVSIYMSFAAARFNVTAAPAYAALGAGILIYFTNAARLTEVKKRRVSTQVSIGKSIKGNISWLHALTSVLIVVLLIIPAGFAMVSAAVPANNAQSVNAEIQNSLPASLRLNNASLGPQFIQSSYSIVNDSQPLSKSFQWLSTQDANLSPNDRPAYVSWWDYGFQEMYQGQHPSVADDFQQGYQVAGQILLAGNQSQIISLFISRVIQGDYQHNGNAFTPQVSSTLNHYFGIGETNLLTSISKNTSSYIPWIVNNATVYGKFISTISTSNAYYALVKGQLSSKYSTSTLVSAYSQLEQDTGSSIKYIQIDSGSLFPQSGLNTGIFYAPAYLTDTPSYATSQGQIVPTNYYQIYEQTANGTFPANQVPTGLQPLNYSIVYTPAFYNTSIYRFTMGYPPSVAGGVNGIPGITFGQQKDQIMPAWNMSHFEISYEGIPWNPYTDYQNHPNAWKVIPLQQAYTYRQEGKGVAEIFPPPSQMIPGGTPIVSYYPGAKINGQITLPNGNPAAGIRLTIFDQYGIPHQSVVTNKNGYYNLTGLPGNDTIAITSGTVNPIFMLGQNTISDLKVTVTQNQAQRVATSYNNTTGLPDYIITKNYVMPSNSVSGFVRYEYQNSTDQKNVKVLSQPLVNTGTLTLYNNTYNVSYSLNIANGQYSANDLMPLSYEASVSTGQSYYSNVSYVNVSNSGSQVNDLFLHFDTFFVNATGSAGNLLPGYTVKAISSNGNTTSNVTDSNGMAMLWVPPGNYTIYAYNRNSVTQLHSQSFSSWGQNVSLNLTPRISASVQGKISGITSSTTVNFYENGIVGETYKTVTDNSGNYNATLPYGTYTAYVRSGNDVAASTFTLSGDSYLNMTMGVGHNMTVGSTLSGQTIYNGAYQILSGSIMLQYNFSKQENVALMLPEGSYTVNGIASYLGNTYSSFKHVYLTATLSLNLSLVINQQTSVFAYDSSIIGGYNSQSAIDTGILTLYRSNIPVMYTEVGKQGFAQVTYGQINASNYYLTYTSPFYSAPGKTLPSGTDYLAVTPNAGKITVNLHPGANAPPVNGVLKLSGIMGYNLTVKNNVATGDVMPGIYYMTITSSTLHVITASPVLAVVTGGGTFTTNATEYASVKVSNAASFSLFASNGTMVADNSNVPVGIYTLYATNGSNVFVSLENITSNRTVQPTYTAGYSMDLSNSMSLIDGKYLLKTSNDVLNLSKGKWELPSGNYQITYSNKVTNSTGSFYVNGATSVSFTGSRSVNVTVTSTRSYTGLTGWATYNGAPSSYSLVELLNSTGNVVALTHTNSQGYYNVTVPHGSYTLYAVNNASMQAYFSNASVKTFGGYAYYNVSMSQGYQTYVSVNLLSNQLTTNLTISIGSKYMLYNTSNNPIVLPQGNFTFSASRSVTQNLYNGSSITVSYSTNYTTDINQKSYVTVTLQKYKTYSFVINQTSSVQTIAYNGTFDGTMTILNAGNSAVNISLESGSQIWDITFNRTMMDLQPGQTVNVSATVKAVGNPPAGLDSIPVLIKYNSQSTTAYLSANVTARPGFSLTEGSAMGIPNGSNVWVPVKLMNTGNQPMSVNFSLPNSTLTLLSETGWKAAFYVGGQQVNRTMLQYNTTVTVYVVMTPATSGASTGVTFGVNFNSTQVNKSISLSTSVPAISTISPYPGGSGIISNYTGNPFGSLEIGLIMIALIVLAGIIVTGMRSRNRGKR